MSIAASKGNDALSWNTLNGGQPIFTSTVGTEGLRDPFIIRAPEGDKFYMIATDLKVAGLAGGFTTAQISGSKYIEVWESTDLVDLVGPASRQGLDRFRRQHVGTGGVLG